MEKISALPVEHDLEPDLPRLRRAACRRQPVRQPGVLRRDAGRAGVGVALLRLDAADRQHRLPGDVHQVAPQREGDDGVVGQAELAGALKQAELVGVRRQRLRPGGEMQDSSLQPLGHAFSEYLAPQGQAVAEVILDVAPCDIPLDPAAARLVFEVEGLGQQFLGLFYFLTDNVLFQSDSFYGRKKATQIIIFIMQLL